MMNPKIEIIKDACAWFQILACVMIDTWRENTEVDAYLRASGMNESPRIAADGPRAVKVLVLISS